MRDKKARHGERLDASQLLAKAHRDFAEPMININIGGEQKSEMHIEIEDRLAALTKQTKPKHEIKDAEIIEDDFDF